MLAWIIVSGLAMSAVALVGVAALAMRPERFRRLVTPLVALAAGALLGGALFHMLPGALQVIEDPLHTFAWVAGGMLLFHVLEQYLHWHHCHRPVQGHQHRPLGHMLLAADAVHNFIGGVAVGSAFVLDVRLGVVTWLVAVAHEIPQELGDFGVLVHSGWSIRHALVYNVASALTFPVGGVIAYALSGNIDMSALIPFAAGNFIYIATADLMPEITTSPDPRDKVLHSATFALGLGLLLLVAVIT